MKLKNSPKGANWGIINQKKETLGKEKRAHFGWAKGCSGACQFPAPTLKTLLEDAKNFFQSQTLPRSSTG